MRSGNTEKVSISLHREVLKTLRTRAKRLYAGNLSAVLGEVAEAAARLEAMDDLIQHFSWTPLTDAERASIEADWYSGKSSKPRRRKKKKA